jgi:GNAT superfamily N-acetyltransferase
MATCDISLRRACPADAERLARAHEEAWRYAYMGIIPHLPLAQMIARRGPSWWRKALERKMPALLLSFDGEAAGYATFGRSRMRATPYSGEIYELYVAPVYQGVGFGRRLFAAARQGLSAAGHRGLIVWALADNDAACGFYRHMGGRPVSEGLEHFGPDRLRKTAFAWR